MLIGHNFDNRVPYAVAERTAERIRGVGRRRAIQHHGPCTRLQLLAHSVPFRVRGDLRYGTRGKSYKKKKVSIHRV